MAALTVPSERDITMIHKTTWSEVWNCYETDEVTPYDFTDHILEMTVETLSYGRDIIQLTTADDSITAGSDGVVTFLITAAQSAGISAGILRYDLFVTYPTGNKEVWTYGKFQIKRSDK